MTKSKSDKLPKPDIQKLVCSKRSIPFNGQLVEQKRLLFLFSAFDKQHKLFNLGGCNEDTTVGGKWFIELLDCLKSVVNKIIPELMNNSTHDLHPIDWSKANTKSSVGYDAVGILAISHKQVKRAVNR